MDSLNRKSTTMKSDGTQKSNVSDAANDLLNEGKKLANELYEDSCSKFSEAEQQFKDYSDTIAKKIKEKPLTSMLIAGGVGFLLSKLFSK